MKDLQRERSEQISLKFEVVKRIEKLDDDICKLGGKINGH